MNFKNWDKKGLTGLWLFTVKIDGVQAQKKDGKIVSKGGNPLYHLPKDDRSWEIAEIFCGSWNDTMSIVRASKSERRLVKDTEIYPLYPNICPQLRVGYFTNPSAETIEYQFQRALKSGFEGLVLIPVEHLPTEAHYGNDTILIRDEDYIKVKPEYTVDIKITGFVEGKGKFKGMLGKFITADGEVGTGYTTLQRELYWKARKKMVGKVIEVLFMEKTKNGKMRNPRFKRLREDKS